MQVTDTKNSQQVTWEQRAAAEAKIRTWLRAGVGPINVSSQAKPRWVYPPKRGELGDYDIDEIAEAAAEKWAADGRANVLTYAARGLATWRRGQRARRQYEGSAGPTETEGPADIDAGRELRKLAGVNDAPPAEMRGIIAEGGRWLDPSDLAPDRLEAALGELAGLANAVAYRTTDPRVQRVAAVLVALADRDDAADLALAKVARGHLGPHRGPAGDHPKDSKARQKTALLRAVKQRNALLIVNTLRGCPDLCSQTAVPVGPWDEEDRRSIIETVQAVLDDKIGKGHEETAKAIMRELGASAGDAKGLTAHVEKGRSRSKP